MTKPKIVLSKCINLAPVRYNGGIIIDNFVAKLMKYVEVIPVCPEVGSGMSVPRASVILVKRLSEIRMIEPVSKRDYTEAVKEFSINFLETIDEVDGFLLKAKSPSCGVKDTKLYKEDLKTLINTRNNGLFAKLVMEKFKFLPLEDEKRIKDYWIRRDFLTKIFSLAELRVLENTIEDINQLIEFHKSYKYLLLLYSPLKLKQIDATEWRKYTLKEAIKLYSKSFREALAKKSDIKKHLNVIQHMFRHFSKKITTEEKKHIQKLIKSFSEGEIPFVTLIEFLKSFVYRFNDNYLECKKYLNPYPEELESFE